MIKTCSFEVEERKKIVDLKFSRDYKYFAFRLSMMSPEIQVVNYEDLSQRVSYDIRNIIENLGGGSFSFQFAHGKKSTHLCVLMKNSGILIMIELSNLLSENYESIQSISEMI